MIEQLAGGCGFFLNHWLASCLVVGATLYALGVFLRMSPDWRASKGRLTASLSYFFIGGSIIGAAAVAEMLVTNRWGWALALVPALLIARHAIYLHLERRRVVFQRVEREHGECAQTMEEQEERRRFKWILMRARAAADRDFAPDALAIRLGLPALLAVLLGVAAFEFLSRDSLSKLTEPTLRGARYALTGAYVYVLLYLGQRAMRRDITSGSAMWAVVTLALGPVMGAVVALIWTWNGGEPPKGEGSWGPGAFYFVAGMSPRYVASLIDEAVRRLWSQRTVSDPQRRLVPLSKLRGIDADAEDRLGEEGITSALGMAMADPLKLLRNTNFDKRLILAWIDEALLFTAFNEEKVAKLEEAGISGAIDLAWCDSKMRSDRTAATAMLQKLAAATGISDVELLNAIAKRFNEDAQVQIVWALYQRDDEDGSDEGEVGYPTAPSPRMSAPPPNARGVGAGGWSAVAALLALAAWFLWTRLLPVQIALDLFLVALAGGGMLAVALPMRPGWITRMEALLASAVGAAGLAYEIYRPTFADASVPLGRVLLGGAAIAAGGYVYLRLLYLRSNIRLAVNVAPPDVDGLTVSIGERSVRSGDMIARGFPVISVGAPGYRQEVRQIDARFGAEARVDVKLTRKLVRLQLQLEMEGTGAATLAAGGDTHVANAEIYIDNKRIPDGQRQVELLPGKHPLAVKGAEFEPYSDEIELSETDDVVTWRLRLHPKLAKLIVNVEPVAAQGVTYFLDQEQQGGNILAVKPGSHVVGASAVGYARTDLTVDVRANEEKMVRIVLTKLPA